MDPKALQDRFGADPAEPIHAGHSAATVVRLSRGRERLYYKAGDGVDVEGDRLAWLGGTGLALMFKSLRGTLNPQYSGPRVCRAVRR